MRPSRILAVTVSAVLGVGLGVATGFALGRNSDHDPLGLDAPMVNQECQANRALLLLASSDSENGLGPELAANPDARYLQTANSCETAWRQEGKVTQAYVVYIGPFSRSDACAMQMTGQHRGDRVTMLTSGTTDTVQCLCWVAYQDAPTLSPGQPLSDLEIVYLHGLQEVLTSMGRRSDIPTTNAYDPQTISEVRSFQKFASRPVTGEMDEGTWKALQGRGCDRT